MLNVVIHVHMFNICVYLSLFFFSFFFHQQSSGQSQNESSNQSLCSLGSLSDKELEVSLSPTLTGCICSDLSRYPAAHTQLVYTAFFTDSREKSERAES